MNSEQRYTRDHVCPVCGGYDRMPRGKGIRCYGYLASSGQSAVCTRVESPRFDARAEGWWHRVSGDCSCGEQHSAGEAKVAPSSRIVRRSRVVANYQYDGPDGTPYMLVRRFEPKDFRQFHYEGAGNWRAGLGGLPPILYRLPALIEEPSRVVWWCEGEADADRLASLRRLSTTFPGGAGKSNDDATRLMKGRRVVVLIDNDDAGRAGSRKLADALLAARVEWVKLLELPGLPAGGDVSDWLDAGHRDDELEQLAREAPECKSEAEAGSAGLPEQRSVGAALPVLPAEFWTKHPVLAHIKQAADSRQCSATAVLFVVLARVAAALHHRVELPPIKGSAKPLSFLLAIVAPPGAGKGAAHEVGVELVDVLPELTEATDCMPIGTGEGMIDTLFEMVPVEDPDTGKVKRTVKRQVHHNAYFIADEGEVIKAFGRREGTVLLPTLRSIFTGGVLGQTNAMQERRRRVPAGTYSYGITFLFQTTAAHLLLDDIEGGTPQRFAWASAVDPAIPAAPPDWPGPLDWLSTGIEYSRYEVDHPNAHRLRDDDPQRLRYRVRIAPAVEKEIRARLLANSHGKESDPLLAHAILLREKMAALLGILLYKRLDVSEELWQWAGTLHATSDATARAIQKVAGAQAAFKSEARTARVAHEEVAKDIAVTHHKIIETAEIIWRKVKESPGITRRDISRSNNRRAEWIGEAIDYLIENRRMEERSEPGQGADKRALYAGPRLTVVRGVEPSSRTTPSQRAPRETGS
jgi:hypothetical protein